MGEERKGMFSREVLSEMTRNDGKSRDELIRDMRGLTARLSLMRKQEKRGALTLDQRKERDHLIEAIVRKKNAIVNAQKRMTRADLPKACNHAGVSSKAYDRGYDLYNGV